MVGRFLSLFRAKPPAPIANAGGFSASGSGHPVEELFIFAKRHGVRVYDVTYDDNARVLKFGMVESDDSEFIKALKASMPLLKIVAFVALGGGAIGGAIAELQ